MATQSESNLIWKIWSAIFLLSGVIIGGVLLLRPGLVRQRTSLSEEVEIINNLLSLKSSFDDLHRAERRASNSSENPDETAAVARAPFSDSSSSEIRPEALRFESLDDEGLEGSTEQELESQRQIQRQIDALQEEIARLETNNRQLVQENNNLRGYQINYQQQIERRRESLQPHLQKIRQFPSVDDTFSLENLTLASLGSTVDFENLKSTLEEKIKKRNELRDNIRFLDSSFSFAIILGLANLLIGGVYYWLDRWNEEQSKKIKETEQKIEAAQSKIRNFGWNMANASLEKYYQRNLMEVQVIFMTSVAVMVLGFLLIIASLAMTLYGSETIVANPEPSSDEQVVDDEGQSPMSTVDEITISPNNNNVATIGVVAGIITNFIGATFMLVYRSTVREASRYSNSLNRINDVGIAMDILNTSVEHKDSPEILAAKVEIAKRLVDSDRHPNVD